MSLLFEVHTPEKPAPYCESLSIADIQYLSDKLIHTRAAQGLSSGVSVSSDYSKLFEAGKTILHSIKYLLHTLSVSKVSLCVNRVDYYTECVCCVQNIHENIIDKFTLTFRYDPKHPPKPYKEGCYEITMCTEDQVGVYSRVITLNPNGIMSYDMNFPSPSEFVSEIYSAIKHK